MDIESIEQIKLLKTLKSTDDKGKPIIWLAGQVFKPEEKPVPQSVLRELTAKRRGGSILEVTFKLEPPPLEMKFEEITEEKLKEVFDDVIEETPDVIPDDIPEEKPTTKKLTPKKLVKRVKT